MDRKDWEELDRLLGLEGFGGYYDLVECLKDIATAWVTDAKTDGSDFEKTLSRINEIKTVKSAISFLLAFSIVRKNKPVIKLREVN